MLGSVAHNTALMKSAKYEAQKGVNSLLFCRKGSLYEKENDYRCFQACGPINSSSAALLHKQALSLKNITQHCEETKRNLAVRGKVSTVTPYGYVWSFTRKECKGEILERQWAYLPTCKCKYIPHKHIHMYIICTYIHRPEENIMLTGNGLCNLVLCIGHAHISSVLDD